MRGPELETDAGPGVERGWSREEAQCSSREARGWGGSSGALGRHSRLQGLRLYQIPAGVVTASPVSSPGCFSSLVPCSESSCWECGCEFFDPTEGVRIHTHTPYRRVNHFRVNSVSFEGPERWQVNLSNLHFRTTSPAATVWRMCCGHDGGWKARVWRWVQQAGQLP